MNKEDLQTIIASIDLTLLALRKILNDNPSDEVRENCCTLSTKMIIARTKVQKQLNS